MKTFELEFLDAASREWAKLAPTIKSQFKRKLEERLRNPHIPSARLHGMRDCYKIKLRKAGYRLVYQVEDERVTVVVIAVGRRDRNLVYEAASQRLL